MITRNLLAGLGGAVALNLLHESLKKTHPDMPRVDLLGEQALQKILLKFSSPIGNENKLYLATLGADLFSNGLFYSLIGAGKRKHNWRNALIMGTIAGTGAIALPKPLGLDPEPVARTTTTAALTFGYYMVGALVTALILEARPAKATAGYLKHGSE